MRWLILAAAGIIGYQLFVPPVIGLADQADFARIAGRFGYAPKAPAARFAFINLRYVHDANARIESWEQVSSEYIFVGAAALLNHMFAKSGELDIRLVGFIHALALLFALGRIFRLARELRVPWWICVAMLLAATDVGYIAYLNSFYTEPATFVFLLLLVGESLAICAHGVSNSRLLAWCAWAVLFVLARPVNAPAGLLLGLFALRLAWKSSVAWAGAAAIFASIIFSMTTAPKEMKDANTYNLIFLAVLPESKAPAADLAALGLDPALAAFSNTSAWSTDTAYDGLRARGVIGKKITLASVTQFFVTHPASLIRHINYNLRVAMLLRPELGNFDLSAGLPPGAQSQAADFWSGFHETILARVSRIIFLLLPVPALCLIFLRRRSLYLEYFALLGLCCVLSFLTASFGDAKENVKHMFLFNLMVDTWLFSTAALCWSRWRSRA